jgi:hypothetical protein
MGEKTKLLRLYSKDDRHLILEGRSIEDVDKFTYLGATMSTEGGGEEDIQERLKKARAVFRNLNKTWKSSVFSRNTKIRIFNTVVKPTLLYGCETWKMTEGNNKMIDYFQTKCLGRILGVFWPNVKSNEELLDTSKCRKFSEEVKRRRWQWIGHISRRDREDHCMTALIWAPEGKRKVGRPKINWRRTVEKERNDMGWSSWSQVRNAATDQMAWKRYTQALCANGREEGR